MDGAHSYQALFLDHGGMFKHVFKVMLATSVNKGGGQKAGAPLPYLGFSWSRDGNSWPASQAQPDEWTDLVIVRAPTAPPISEADDTYMYTVFCAARDTRGVKTPYNNCSVPKLGAAGAPPPPPPGWGDGCYWGIGKLSINIKLPKQLKSDDNSAVAGCLTAFECGLAGACTNGTCICDAWATGDKCTVLNARPAETSRAFYRSTNSSWGGSAVRSADGRYHMYASSFINSCGFTAWEANSEVLHASSADGPEGPFISDDVASPPWTHNPTVTKADKLYILYHLGVGKRNGNPHTNCSDGVTRGKGAADELAGPPPPPPPPLMPSVSWSDSPGGPWSTQAGTREGWGLNNPAAVFLKNGSVFMLYKASCDRNPSGGFCRQFAVSNCATFKGPCTPLRKIPIYGEDAGIFRDQRGAFHIFFHGGNYAACSNAHTQACNYSGPSCSRVHKGKLEHTCYFHTAWSADGLDWHMDGTQNVFNWTIQTKGGGAVNYADRARHQVLLDADGELSHVYGGVRRDSETDFTLTAVQPVHTSKTLKADDPGADLQRRLHAAAAASQPLFVLPRGDVQFMQAFPSLQVLAATNLKVIGHEGGTTLLFPLGGGLRVHDSVNVSLQGFSIDYYPLRPYVQAKIIAMALADTYAAPTPDPTPAGKRPAPPCPFGWWLPAGSQLCDQGCQSGAQARNASSGRCLCAQAAPNNKCIAGETCVGGQCSDPPPGPPPPPPAPPRVTYTLELANLSLPISWGDVAHGVLWSGATNRSKHEGVPSPGGAQRIGGAGSRTYSWNASVPGAVVGDYMTFAGRDNYTVVVANSSSCTMTDVVILSAPGFAITEIDGEGGHRYERVRIGSHGTGMQPSSGQPLLVGANADALHSVDVAHGPTLVGCDFSGNCDDFINVRGKAAVLCTPSV